MHDMQLRTLRSSREFKRVRGGRKAGTASFLIEGKARPGAADGDSERGEAATAGEPRFGFTVTKKIGGAVVRNRVRRRLKAIVRDLDPALARPEFDYVVVARSGAVDQPFADLSAEFRRALRHVGRLPPRAADIDTSGSVADGPPPSLARAAHQDTRPSSARGPRTRQRAS